MRSISPKFLLEEKRDSQVFHFYPNLPWELRRLIVKKLDDGTKLSFMLCSDSCAADIPKNFIKTLRFYPDTLEVNNHCNFNLEPDSAPDSSFKWLVLSRLEELYLPNRKKCYSIERVLISKEKVEYTSYDQIFAKIINYATDFEVLDIEITNTFLSTIPNIRNLKVFKNLKIKNCTNIDLLAAGFINCEQFSRVREYIELTNFTLTIPQLSKLTAEAICCQKSKISSGYIHQLLLSFLDGQIPETVKYIEFTTAQDYCLNNVAIFQQWYAFQPGQCHDHGRAAMAHVGSTVRIAEIRSRPNDFSMQIHSKKEFYEKFPIDTFVVVKKADK